jgi:hypothetical protein
MAICRSVVSIWVETTTSSGDMTASQQILPGYWLIKCEWHLRPVWLRQIMEYPYEYSLRVDRHELSTAYIKKKLSLAEQNYTITEQEMLGVIYALQT